MADSTYTTKYLNASYATEIHPPTGGFSATSVYVAAPSGFTGFYAYKVTACNGGETSGNANPIHIKGIASGIDVYFSLVDGASDYKLYRAESGNTNYRVVNYGTGSPIRDLGVFSGGFIPTTNNTNQVKHTIGSSGVKLYQVGASKRTLLKEIIATNGDVVDNAFSIYMVDNGDSPSYANKIFDNIVLEPNESKILSLNSVLETGDKIYAAAEHVGYVPGYGAVKIRIAGIEITD